MCSCSHDIFKRNYFSSLNCTYINIQRIATFFKKKQTFQIGTIVVHGWIESKVNALEKVEKIHWTEQIWSDLKSK